jgi:hypothetical protein
VDEAPSNYDGPSFVANAEQVCEQRWSGSHVGVVDQTYLCFLGAADIQTGSLANTILWLVVNVSVGW